MAESRMLAPPSERDGHARASPMQNVRQLLQGSPDREAGGRCRSCCATIPCLESRRAKPEFLARNPNGRVPLLEWETGAPRGIRAIIWHLAKAPLSLRQTAGPRRTLSGCSSSSIHEPYVGLRASGWPTRQKPNWRETTPHPEWPRERKRGARCYGWRLRDPDWFAGDRIIADIASRLHALRGRRRVRHRFISPVARWIARVREQPRHIPLWKP